MRAAPAPAPAEAAAAAAGPRRGCFPLRLFASNDVYNINEPADETQSGGAARFVGKLRELRAETARKEDGRQSLTLFSGDVFSPSTISTVVKGEQMPPVVQAMGVQAACLGNHDFDFGMETLNSLMEACGKECRWVMSNVVNAVDGRPIAGTERGVVLEVRYPTTTAPDDDEADAESKQVQPAGAPEHAAEEEMLRLPTDGRHHAPGERESDGAASPPFSPPPPGGSRAAPHGSEEEAVLRVGIMGLVEREWLDTLTTIVEGQVEYIDFVDAALTTSEVLRSEGGADIVIALSHMRTHNDMHLARHTAGSVDLILGGHDHEVVVRNLPPEVDVVTQDPDTDLHHLAPAAADAPEVEAKQYVPMIKNGTDFQTLGVIDLIVHMDEDTDDDGEGGAGTGEHHQEPSQEVDQDGSGGGDDRRTRRISRQLRKRRRTRVELERVEHVEITTDMERDPEVVDIVNTYMQTMEEGMDEVLAEVGCDLDARFTSVRQRETNIGNYLCDILRESTQANVVLLNSGTMRCDRIIPEGDCLRVRDLIDILPMPDEVVVLRVSGLKLLAALQNACSMFPRNEGRFAQISGATYSFDALKPPGRRVLVDSVYVGGEPLDLTQTYTVAVKEYLQRGGDGYTMFKNAEVVMDTEMFPPLQTMVRNHLTVIRHINQVKKRRDPLVRQKSLRLVKQLSLGHGFTSHAPSLADHHVLHDPATNRTYDLREMNRRAHHDEHALALHRSASESASSNDESADSKSKRKSSNAAASASSGSEDSGSGPTSPPSPAPGARIVRSRSRWSAEPSGRGIVGAAQAAAADAAADCEASGYGRYYSLQAALEAAQEVAWLTSQPPSLQSLEGASLVQLPSIGEGYQSPSAHVNRARAAVAAAVSPAVSASAPISHIASEGDGTARDRVHEPHTSTRRGDLERRLSVEDVMHGAAVGSIHVRIAPKLYGRINIVNEEAGLEAFAAQLRA